MKRINFKLSGIKIIFYIVLALFLNGCSERVKLSPEKSKTDVSTTAMQIWADYKDAKSADQKYLMKIIELTGTIEATGTNVINIPYVLLQTGDPAGGVQCFFSKKFSQQGGELKIGQMIKIRGRGLGKVIHVGVDDCIIQ